MCLFNKKSYHVIGLQTSTRNTNSYALLGLTCFICFCFELNKIRNTKRTLVTFKISICCPCSGALSTFFPGWRGAQVPDLWRPALRCPKQTPNQGGPSAASLSGIGRRASSGRPLALVGDFWMVLSRASQQSFPVKETNRRRCYHLDYWISLHDNFFLKLLIFEEMCRLKEKFI